MHGPTNVKLIVSFTFHITQQTLTNSHDTLTLQNRMFGISINSEVEHKTLYAVLRIYSLVYTKVF